MIQGSEEWFKARLGKVTASRIADVMKKPTTEGYQGYRAELVLERLTGEPADSVQTAAMTHGNETEAQARASYAFCTGLPVQQVGFIQHPSMKWAGASPDGLIGDAGGLEIKCPQPKKHMQNILGAEIDRGYGFQVQWNMAVTGRSWWDFSSFNPDFPPHLRTFVQRVDRDPKVISEITAKVSQFLIECDRLFEELMKSRDAA